LTSSEIPASTLAPAILEQGAKWLLQSGIQEPSCGVARYHFTDRNQNARISTEITGYFISSFCGNVGRCYGNYYLFHCGKFNFIEFFKMILLIFHKNKSRSRYEF